MKWLTFRTQREPGFRLNLIDLLALLALVFVSRGWWHVFPYQHLYLLPLYVFGSFFLFCNVFRIGNRWEVPWYLTFLALALYGYTRTRFPWMLLLAVCETVKLVLIACRIRCGGAYVGVFHERVSRLRGVRRYAAPLGMCLLMSCAFAGVPALLRLQPGDLRWCVYSVTGRGFSDGQARVWPVRQLGMVVVRLAGGFDVIHNPQRTSSLREIAERHGSDYVINGSYFESNGEHAGWLWLKERQMAPLKPDRQLTHIVRYDPRSGSMRFVEVKSYDTNGPPFPIELQTGPLVVARNRIAKRFIDDSINGNGQFRRTLLGYTEEDRAVYFIVTRQEATLGGVADALLGMRVFRNKTLTVVNLDGGPSTALLSRNHPRLDIVPMGSLPLFLVSTHPVCETTVSKTGLNDE